MLNVMVQNISNELVVAEGKFIAPGEVAELTKKFWQANFKKYKDILYCPVRGTALTPSASDTGEWAVEKVIADRGTEGTSVTGSDGCTYTAKKKDGIVYVTDTNTHPTGISLSASAASIAVDGTSKITVAWTPSGTTNKTVTWKSSKTSVATVAAGTGGDAGKGIVTGKGAGTATITATTQDGKKTATVTITVTSE
jgi:uncharacterized protein YjdB